MSHRAPHSEWEWSLLHARITAIAATMAARIDIITIGKSACVTSMTTSSQRQPVHSLCTIEEMCSLALPVCRCQPVKSPQILRMNYE